MISIFYLILNMISKIQFEDRSQWKNLYRSYADFYKAEMTEEILNTVWKWLRNKEHVLNDMVCEADGYIFGFAHFRRVLTPLRGKAIGFLDDLFVEPKFRGKIIGEKILKELNIISQSNRWSLIRWIMHSDNLTAKKLYDRIAEKTKWNLCELK